MPEIQRLLSYYRYKERRTPWAKAESSLRKIEKLASFVNVNTLLVFFFCENR